MKKISKILTLYCLINFYTHASTDYVVIIDKEDNTYNHEKKSYYIAKSCKDILDNGFSIGSGLYNIKLESGDKKVLCDMDTDGGGWTVFQKRISNTDFFLNWEKYKNGFGSEDNFWLGNDIISEMTKNNTELYVAMGHHNGIEYYSRYSTFKVADSSEKYRLTATGFSGNNGDGLNHHNGNYFSTKDQDNDNHSVNCASQYSGAWWYGACHDSNLNGLYLDGTHTTNGNGMNWHYGHGQKYSYKTTKMMFR